MAMHWAMAERLALPKSSHCCQIPMGNKNHTLTMSPSRRHQVLKLKPPWEAGVRITEGEAEAERGYVTYLGSHSSLVKLNPNVICLQSCLPPQSHSLYRGLTLCEQAAINQGQQNTYFEVIQWDKGYEILVRDSLGNICPFSASPSWQDTSLNANEKIIHTD